MLITKFIFNSGKFDDAVDGPTFLKNPNKHIINKNWPLLIMQSGINTGCGLDKRQAGTLYEWQTHMAYALRDKFKQAIFVNWGALACANYFCLLKNFVESCGTILGKMIVEHLIPEKITFAVQSIAGE